MDDRGLDETVICCEQLTKLYPGGVLAVDRLDLAVHPGEIFGLLGPNGAGKTTTAGMLTTRVIPTSGRAIVAGIDVVAHPALAKQLIGVVPQTNTLDRALTRLGEPLLPRPVLRHERQGARAAADEAAGPVPPDRAGQGAGDWRSRAAWRSGS